MSDKKPLFSVTARDRERREQNHRNDKLVTVLSQQEQTHETK